MSKIRININGKELFGFSGQTILEVAQENDIFIPTLCYDERMDLYGACGLCVCEVQGNPKMVKACATEIAPNMVVLTDTPRVYESRKTNLELLLTNHVGDCRPPCVLACPAQQDCQGYVSLIANGEFEKAIELIKNRIPLPASLGRVCPHPCEDECRRALVDEPISIRNLKRFASDTDRMSQDSFMPDMAPDSGKSVAIIGGGPLGLSAAYFLRIMGHSVTIFESMPKAGGMLRYGIPEYRLPNEEIDWEIGIIEKMGVNIITNTKIGVDIPFDTIKSDYDAVLLGIGAWVSTGVGCKGEDTQNVIGGIDFLRKVVRNEEINLGKNVAIVGGGNTAMDACRTAVRLGAEKVYNVYRRTKDEMPADLIEIVEAEEEGVIFKNLANPCEILANEEGCVCEMVLQAMELGEPDASGRRAPMPIEGQKEGLEVDTIILAIGQAVDGSIFDVEKTKRGGIAYDPETFMTSMPGVFAGGDCGNDQISIAVEAIADARKASYVIDSYLNGESVKYETPYVVIREDITEKTFEDRERQCRPKLNELAPDARKDNFLEIVKGYTEEEAIQEGARCLECGCHDFFECKLIEYANDYKVEPTRFAGEIKTIDFEDDHPFIVRDPAKCILCGLCVRICDDVMGIGALGLVDRGFDTVVKPTLDKPLLESGCVSCGQCVSNCPCGALQERQTVIKEVPVDTDCVETTCGYCSVGCSHILESYGSMLIKSNPDHNGVVNKGLGCGKGKWGFDCGILEGKLELPLVKEGKEFVETEYEDALMITAKKLQGIAAKYGKDKVAVSISDRYSNEEAYVMKKFAQSIGAKTFSFNNRANGLAEVLGVDASPNTIDELLSTELIIVAGFQTVASPVIKLKLKQAAESGVKVVVLNAKGLEDELAFSHQEIKTKNDISGLKELAKALIDAGKASKNPGFEEFAKSLENVKISKGIADVAAQYLSAKKAMIVFQQNIVSVEAAKLIGEIALLSGHIGSPRDGILMIKAKNNSQGLIDLGIKAGAETLDDIKALVIFGEDAKFKTDNLEFLMVSDTHMTKTAKKADVVFPATSFASTDGTFTNTERRLLGVEAAIDEGVLSNWQLVQELALIFENDFGYESTMDISREMDDQLPKYKYAHIGEVLGGALKPQDTKYFSVEDGKLIDPLICSDNLMNTIAERLPKPVKL